MAKPTKEQTATAGLSALASVCVSLTAVWAFAAPIAQKALAGEIEKQLSPLVEAQKILLTSNVSNFRASIAAMEFKREMCAGVPNCWSVRDAQDLAKMRVDLDAADLALKKLNEIR